jgi:hypothetical protein
VPTSHHSQINQIMQLIVLTDPKSLLDIGVGFGKYGFLAREFLELWDGREEMGGWTRRIDGIEIFTDYLTPVHEYVYDSVYEGNATDVLPTLDTRYDLTLLIDVLEHFDREPGEALLAEILRKSRNVIISVPRNIGVQGEAFGNPHETHRFQWERRHLKMLPNAAFIRHADSTLCFAGEDGAKIRPSLRYLNTRSWIRRWCPGLRFIYKRMRKSKRILPTAL